MADEKGRHEPLPQHSPTSQGFGGMPQGQQQAQQQQFENYATPIYSAVALPQQPQQQQQQPYVTTVQPGLDGVPNMPPGYAPQAPQAPGSPALALQPPLTEALWCGSRQQFIYKFETSALMDAKVPRGAWKDEWLDCCTQFFPTCLYAFFCPCILLGQLTDRLGMMPFFWVVLITISLVVLEVLTTIQLHGMFLLVVLVAARRYAKVRFGFPERSCWNDCCLSFWCFPCSLSQLARHVFSYQGGCDTARCIDPEAGHLNVVGVDGAYNNRSSINNNNNNNNNNSTNNGTNHNHGGNHLPGAAVVPGAFPPVYATPLSYPAGSQQQQPPGQQMQQVPVYGSVVAPAGVNVSNVGQ